MEQDATGEPSMAQLHVDAVVELIESRRITDAQANAINKALLARSTEQLKKAFSQIGDAFKAIGGDAPDSGGRGA